MANGRKIETEGEAQRCLLAAKLAGRNAGEWAREHGIDGRSLHAWQVNLERSGTNGPARRRESKLERASHALVELIPAARSAGVEGAGRYVLEVGGARLEFGDDVSVATLRRVLEALRPC